MQAQDTRACRLSVRARTTGLTASDVDAAVAGGEVVRTWAMRGTLHMLTAQDVGWIVALLGPRFAKGMRGRRHRLGLDDDTCARAVAALRSTLTGSTPLTRAELMAEIGFELGGQAPAHLLAYAAMTSVIRRGPEAAKDEPTYVLLGEHEPVERPVAELARRYLTGYAPASADDFAAWSGLPLGASRAAFAELGEQFEPVGENRYAPTGFEPVTEEVVRLLGHFDAYLLGYRGRADAVDPAYDKRINTGGGFVMPALLVDGRVLGTWRRGGTVEIEPFEGLPDGVADAVRAEIADVTRFLSAADPG